jgi:hypothetical protein
MEQPGESRLESFLLDSAERGRRPLAWPRRALLALLAFVVLLGWYWSLEPAPFSLSTVPELRGKTVIAPGVAMTLTLRYSVQGLLEKPGGFVANDLMPPGVWLDNMAAFERGVLAASRDMVRAMRRDFSHAAEVTLEDTDLLRAEPRLAFDSNDWLTTEDEYRKGIAALDSYRQRLEATPPQARFHARPDALARWLTDIETQLDAYGLRLAAAAGGDAPTEWSQVDDVFYEARGYAWALRAQQDAMGIDFAAFIAAAGATDVHRRVMAELDGALRPIRSPVVMNGSEYGMLANHSLVIAGYLARTRSGLRQLREQLGSREGNP